MYVYNGRIFPPSRIRPSVALQSYTTRYSFYRFFPFIKASFICVYIFFCNLFSCARPHYCFRRDVFIWEFSACIYYKYEIPKVILANFRLYLSRRAVRVLICIAPPPDVAATAYATWFYLSSSKRMKTGPNERPDALIKYAVVGASFPVLKLTYEGR